MVSKNNKLIKEQYCAINVPHYGLRKMSIGVASVLLSTTLYMVNGNGVKADTVTNTQSNEPSTSAITTSLENKQPSNVVTEATSPSPTTPAKAVGLTQPSTSTQPQNNQVEKTLNPEASSVIETDEKLARPDESNTSIANSVVTPNVKPMILAAAPAEEQWIDITPISEPLGGNITKQVNFGLEGKWLDHNTAQFRFTGNSLSSQMPEGDRFSLILNGSTSYKENRLSVELKHVPTSNEVITAILPENSDIDDIGYWFTANNMSSPKSWAAGYAPTEKVKAFLSQRPATSNPANGNVFSWISIGWTGKNEIKVLFDSKDALPIQKMRVDFYDGQSHDKSYVSTDQFTQHLMTNVYASEEKLNKAAVEAVIFLTLPDNNPTSIGTYYYLIGNDLQHKIFELKSQQTIKVVYVDDDNQQTEVSSASLTGKNDETVDTNITAPKNYVLVGTPPKNYTFKENDNTVITVHLKHQTQATSDQKQVTRTVNYTDPTTNQTKAVTTQTATLQRTGTKDLVTNETKWNAWNTAQWTQVTAPKVTGYRVTNPDAAAAMTVTSGTNNTTVTFTYVSDQR